MGAMTIYTLLVIVLLFTPAFAQDLVGRWSGRMEPKNLSAEIELDLQREGASWKAALTFRSGPDGSQLTIEELRVEGDSVILRTKIEGADMQFELAFENDLLFGSVRLSEGGQVLVEGPAGLARASDAEAMKHLMSLLDAQGTLIEPERRGKVIENAVKLMLANYIFLDRAEQAVADLRERVNLGEYDSLTNAARLAEALSSVLATSTGDGHLHVKYSDRRVPDPLAEVEETPAQLEQLRLDAAAENFGIGTTSVLEGNVGYLQLTRFFRAEFAGDALAAAMTQLASTDALMVDLRDCHGGDPVMAVLTASWFFDGRPRHWNDMYRRFDNTTTQYWTAAWLPGERYVGKPLYVLTAQRTFSAPESLAYELQQTRRATIVGETTGGGAHSGAWFPIDDQFAIFIPLSRSISATSGSDWEGAGVKPDVLCEASQAFDVALNEALAKLVSATKGK